MPEHQGTAAEASRQDPFRWRQADILDALDEFSQADAPSQRQFAQQLGIPQSTFNYWTRHYSASSDDPVDCFFRSGPGELVLRRILCSALTTFAIEGACGVRKVSTFLQRANLDRFVACSPSALHPLVVHLESDLLAFRDEQQPLLAEQMDFKTITLTTDEHFHAVKPCLVAMEPVSGFILVECYRDNRDADTWTAAINEGTTGMHIQVVLLTSDLAKALLCCAEKGLQVAHSPDLFHDQRTLLQPLLLPLNRPIQQAQKDLEKAKGLSRKLDGALEQPRTEEQFDTVVEAVRQEMIISEQLQQAKEVKEEAVQQVRAIGDDYHPFDRHTGKPCAAEEVGQRLNTHLDKLQEVVKEAGLSGKAQEAVDKSRKWVATLMAVVAWFWCLAEDRIEELDLTEEQEDLLKNKLLPSYYWEMAAQRARTAEERARLKQMAEDLKKQAWQEAALSSLPEEKRKEVEKVAKETAGLFQRSSSCVEGRNGRLSLQHHGHGQVREQRLKALTVIHNYMVKRPDGTTAAERFFGVKHPDVFSWLLQRMPDLPRPAPKRPKPPAVPSP